MRKLWRILSSIKTAAVLIGLLAALLLVNVAVPRQRGAMPTSPIFLAVTGLFFVNLAAVIGRRAAATFKRIRPRNPSATQLERRAAKASLRLPRPAGWSGSRAAALLRKLGYTVSRPGDRCLFAEKNRTGLLGFLVFHLSFFPIVAGGLMLYYTRFEATELLSEGQSYDPATASVLRHAPLGDADNLAFTLVNVDPVQQDGHPVHLAITIASHEGGETVRRTAEVNHPASIGHIDLLVDRVGVAPVVQLLDPRGIVVDHVAVPAPLSRGDMSLGAIGDQGHEIELDPVPVDERFPSRAELGATPIGLRVFRGDQQLFSGALRPGEVAPLDGYALRLAEVRYWTTVHIVAERGGWLLIAGFALAVAGLIWRMLFVRKEVGVVWYDDAVVLFGRTEFYRARFDDDLEALGGVLIEPPTQDDETDT